MKLPKTDVPAPEQSKITLNLCFHMSLEVLLMAEEATRPVLPVFEIWEERMDAFLKIFILSMSFYWRMATCYLHKL